MEVYRSEQGLFSAFLACQGLFALLITYRNSSSVRRILLEWWYQLESVMRLSNMHQDIAVNVEYLRLPIYTGQTTYVAGSTNLFPPVLTGFLY
jgi:hypothetical protein